MNRFFVFDIGYVHFCYVRKENLKRNVKTRVFRKQKLKGFLKGQKFVDQRIKNVKTRFTHIK